MNDDQCSWWRKNEELFRTLYLLFLGQLVSVFLAIMIFTSSLTTNLGMKTPLTLSFFSYLALSLVYGSVLLHRRRKLLVPWYWYVLLGFADVQGNYLVNTAYQFTSITSVTILDCWTIAWSIVFTWLFLGTRYSFWQFSGAAVCVAGLGLILLSDAQLSNRAGSKPLLGDTLVIMGTIFFSLSNVAEEFCVKKKDFTEVVAMLAIFGMLVSVFEIAVLEWKSLESANWSPEILSAFAGYAIANSLFYSLLPILLKKSGSTLLNLSLLTSDMWAVVIRVLFYKQQIGWLYYLAFAVVVVGLLMYSKSEKNATCGSTVVTLEDGNLSHHYQLLEEESTHPKSDVLTSQLISNT